MILYEGDNINKDRAVWKCTMEGTWGSGGYRVRQSWIGGLNPYMGLYIGLNCFYFIHCADQWFSTKGYFVPQRTLGNVWSGMGWGATGIWWETRDVTNILW